MPGGLPFDQRAVSRGYAFVGAPPAPSLEFPSRVLPDWPKAIVTWALLCVAVWCVDGTAREAGSSSLTHLRERAWRAFVAEHRVGIAVAGALLLPVPIPIGILLVVLVASGGFVGSGYSGVGAGGPALVLLVILLIGLLAGAIFALLTLFLRRVLSMDVPWRP